jgi:hypothetical protein
MEKFMKTSHNPKKIRFCCTLSRLRIATAGMLVLGAAGLAATLMMPPKFPWAVPTVAVGINPIGVDIDLATNTIYVANIADNTISVIEGRRCNSRNNSDCAPIATITNAGFGPFWPVFDPASNTLYVVNAFTESGDNGNSISVIDVSHCRAGDTSGIPRDGNTRVRCRDLRHARGRRSRRIIDRTLARHSFFSASAGNPA